MDAKQKAKQIFKKEQEERRLIENATKVLKKLNDKKYERKQEYDRLKEKADKSKNLEKVGSYSKLALKGLQHKLQNFFGVETI